MTKNDEAAIRRRPGMYVGDTEDGSGILHMLFEVLANALDLHLAGKCDFAEIVIDAKGKISVTDNGPGIRIDVSEGISFAERALTKRHNGPTLDGHQPHEHLNSFAQGEFGLYIVCALSSELQLDVYRDGRHFQQCFARGRATSRMLDRGPSALVGTRISFVPDPEIFAEHRYCLGLDSVAVSKRLEELAFLLPGMRFQFSDQRKQIFHAQHGLQDLLEQIRIVQFANSNWQYPLFEANGIFGVIEVEIVARWTNSAVGEIRSFANIHPTTGGGTHVQGFLLGLLSGLRECAPILHGLRATPRILKNLRAGLLAVVRVRLRDPTFGAPTRDRLCHKDAQLAVKKCMAQSFAKHLEATPALLAQLVSRVCVTSEH